MNFCRQESNMAINIKQEPSRATKSSASSSQSMCDRHNEGASNGSARNACIPQQMRASLSKCVPRSANVFLARQMFPLDPRMFASLGKSLRLSANVCIARQMFPALGKCLHRLANASLARQMLPSLGKARGGRHRTAEMN